VCVREREYVCVSVCGRACWCARVSTCVCVSDSVYLCVFK
jgi:hypothetical protein